MNNENDLASFCLFTYNQENYIQEAIEGALSQTYQNLEIIISDDCSSDGTQDIIRKMVKDYNGPHKIITNFNTVNLGLVPHVNKILYEICSGEFIFLAAGDDISLPARVNKTINFYKNNKDVVATGSDVQEIDHFSKKQNSRYLPKRNEDEIYGLDYFISSSYQHLYGCSRTFRRVIINSFPPLDLSCPTEDTPLLFRAFLLNKKVAALEEVMVKYRIHGNNISSPQNIVRMSVNDIFEQYDADLDFARKENYIIREEYYILRTVLKKRKKYRLNKKSTINNVILKIFGVLKRKINHF